LFLVYVNFIGVFLVQMVIISTPMIQHASHVLLIQSYPMVIPGELNHVRSVEWDCMPRKGRDVKLTASLQMDWEDNMIFPVLEGIV